ncbi:MAG: hypothetical protein L6Q97_23575 [Thermoanaerobaculia bacterium]|nr:hypothetical protein [Thermoanaerobaculia bacterium]
MNDERTLLCPGAIYHIYNRGNNRETIFYTDENYRYFLGKYAKYLTPVLDTYAYCLLPNHFHLAVRVKTLPEIVAGAGRLAFPGFKNLESLEQLPESESAGVDAGAGGLAFPGFKNLESLNDNDLGRLVSNQFRLCFMSYAKAFNKQHNRTGSLFQKNFKRIPIENTAYLANLILYIHANPQLHGIWDDYREWPHSSYPALLSEGVTRLQRTRTLDIYGGKDAFIQAHEHYYKLKIMTQLMIED